MFCESHFTIKSQRIKQIEWIFMIHYKRLISISSQKFTNFIQWWKWKGELWKSSVKRSKNCFHVIEKSINFYWLITFNVTLSKFNLLWFLIVVFYLCETLPFQRVIHLILTNRPNESDCCRICLHIVCYDRTLYFRGKLMAFISVSKHWALHVLVSMNSFTFFIFEWPNVDIVVYNQTHLT